MRSRTILVNLTLLFVFLCCQISTAGQNLRYNYKNTKVYRYSSIIENKTSGQSMGQEFTMTSSTVLDYSISPVSANDGVLTLIVKFEKFNVKLNIPMMGFEDSTIVMQEYVGKRVRVVMSDKGRTLSIEPIDTIPPSRIQMMVSLTPSDLFKQILLELPEKELEINGSWKKDQSDTISRGGIKMVTKPNIKFKIVGAEKKNDFNCWKIAIDGASIIEGSGTQQGADITIDGSVKINGAAFIAPEEGIFVFSEQSNDTEMTTTFTGSQTGASTMSINTTVKTALIK